MQSIPTTIAELEAEVLVVEDRRARLVSAIATLQALQVPRADVAPARCANAKTKAAKTPKAAAKPSKTSAREEAAPSASTDRESIDDRNARIVAAVREHGPIAPGVLATRLGYNLSSALRHHIKALVADGRIIETGKSAAIRFAAPGGLAQTPASSKPSPAAAPTSALDAVQARDAAVLTRLKVGKATLDQLLNEVTLVGIGQDPDSKRIALKQSLRRLTFKGHVMDVGEYYRAV